MNFPNEIKAYKRFCKIYFNKFYSNHTQIITRKDCLRLFQIINLFQIIYNYSTKDHSILKLSTLCLSSLYNLLIAIPSNNDLFIASCTRQFDEELLEIVYSQYCYNEVSYNIEKLLKLNYRSLWQDGIQKASKYQKLSATKRKGRLQEIT